MFLFKYYSFVECGETIQCSSYFSVNQQFTSPFKSNSLTISLISGYNKFLYAVPIFIKKGHVLVLSYTSLARVELGQNTNIHYSDYQIQPNSPQSTLLPINPNAKIQFLINSLIDTGFYLSLISITKKYPFYLAYNFTAKISNSSVFLFSEFNLNLGNSILKKSQIIQKQSDWFSKKLNYKYFI